MAAMTIFNKTTTMDACVQTTYTCDAKYALDLLVYLSERDISPLRAQRLLYILQSYFCVNTKFPLFKESFQCWKYGPVIPEIFDLYKTLFERPIPCNPHIVMPTKNIVQIFEHFLTLTENIDTRSLIYIVNHGKNLQKFSDRVIRAYITDKSPNLEIPIQIIKKDAPNLLKLINQEFVCYFSQKKEG